MPSQPDHEHKRVEQSWGNAHEKQQQEDFLGPPGPSLLSSLQRPPRARVTGRLEAWGAGGLGAGPRSGNFLSLSVGSN